MKAKFVSSAILMFCGLMGVGLSTPYARAGGVHADFVVARTASNQLVVEADPDILSGAEPIQLELITSGPLTGLYGFEEPGWESIEMDEPDEGFFALNTPHQVALQRVNFGAGFQMYDAAFSPILETNGATYAFPQSPPGVFHQDLFFAAVPEDLEPGEAILGTFQLVDLQSSPLHAASAPFQLSIIPEPATLSLLALGLWATVLRRRVGGVDIPS